MNKFLITMLLLIVANLTFADIICVKNSNPVNKKNRVKLKNALVVSTNCPRGYTALLDTVEFKGPQGIQGVNGNTGPEGDTKKEEFYFRGSTGSSLLAIGSLHYSLIGVSAPTVNPAHVAVIAGKDCNTLSADFRVSDAPGAPSTGWRISLVKIADLSTGALDPASLTTLCQILDTNTSCSGNVSRSFSANDFIALRISRVGVVEPTPARGSFLVKCED